MYKKTSQTDKEMKKADIVYGVFESIAEGYDGANERISLGMQKSWKRMLTSRIIRKAPEKARFLDVCCGTGDIAFTIAKHRKDMKVYGIDFSPAMLKVAKQKKKKKKIKNARFFEGDAMELPFKDNTFRGASISFGLRNTSDYEQVLSEMKRVVKPGDCVYILDSFVPQNRLVQPFYTIYFRFIMPLLGGGNKHRQEYEWLSHSTKEFLNPEQLSDLLQNIGFTCVRKKKRLFGACVMIWAKTDINKMK